MNLNMTTAINMLAIPVITYSFNITDRNLSEVKGLDTKVRKIMTTQGMHHPRADIHRLYLPRSNKGRGLTQLKLSYKTSTIGSFRYLNLSDDWMLRLALKHEKEKVSHSVVKEAKEFLQEIDLDFETEFDGKMKNTENARKSERIAKGKGKGGCRYYLKVKTVTWPILILKPKS